METYLSFFFLMLSIGTYAQDSTSGRYEYCQIVGTAKLLSTKVTIRVDYGNDVVGEKIKDPKQIKR